MTSKLSETTRPSTIRTFLIADIRGWTRFTRELGDEAASRLAAKFAQVVGEGVEAWGGQLLELRGDEALVTFESARRALRCAVELQEAFADETAAAPELPLNVGIGLDAGEAVPVGDGYRGTSLNVAARLCSTAQPGEVVATASLAHLAGRVEGLTFAQLDAKPMKGFEDPVPAVLVDSAVPHEHDPSGVEPLPSPPPLPAELDSLVPIVGRESDLRWLSWHWRRARHGHGGVVAVSGPPGVGRTRLVAELAALAHRDGAVVVYGGEHGEGADGGNLVLLDDADAMPEHEVDELARLLASGTDGRLIVLTTKEPVPDGIVRRFRGVRVDERQRRLGPIDLAAVTEIARLYLDDPEVDVPAHLIHEESQGIPAAVHRFASQWARATARRRLGDSARRTSRERRDLRAAEAAMIDDVERLELTRERTRLYAPALEADADAEGTPMRSVCPYKGLATFEATDAEYYFGRERLVADLIARMVGSSFIGLIGASGSGKSSALQAGLLPELAGGVIPGSDEWIQVAMRPGEHPMRELQRALHRSLPRQPPPAADPTTSLGTALDDMGPAQRLLLVIDHFEELFTSATDEAERHAFIDLVTAQRAGLKVLAAVRADQYEHCAAYPRLARLIGAEQVLVGPLTAVEIAAIIRHPAERVGLRVEPELVEALVADIGTEPGGLPLLSTALLELWEMRDGDRLTLAAYRATGGVRGAVARLADAAYTRLDAQEQAEARSIFLRLAGETDTHAVVRRRVPLDELDLDDAPQSETVLAVLTAGRLLTANEGYVEVAHEALLREWPRLRAWIEEDSSGRQLRLHLMASARAWEEGGREPGDLYRGARLAAVLDWSADHGAELNALERAFIDESRAAGEREAQQQRRTNHRLRGLLAGTGAFLVLAVAAGVTALVQAARADDEARVARARELWASSIAVLDQDPELTLLLALEAASLGVDPSAEAVTALHSAVQRARTILSLQLPAPDERPIQPGAVLAPDGRSVYASSEAGRILEYDVDRGDLVREIQLADAGLPEFVALALNSDGTTLGHVDRDGDVHLVNLETGEIVVHEGPGYNGDTLVFSNDGERIATISYENETPDGLTYVSVMEAVTGSVLQQWSFEFMWSVSFHPDGNQLLGTACPCNEEEAVIVMDVRSGETAVQVGSEEGIIQTSPTAARFSPDGSLLATAGLDRRVNLWDTETGVVVATLAGHTAPATDISFSPDGGLIATTGRDGTTRVWDVEREQILLTLAGQSGFPAGPSFSADGRRLVTVSSDLSLRVWDLSAVRTSEGEGLELDDAFLQIKDVDVRGETAAILGRPCRAGPCIGSPGTVGITQVGSSAVLSIPGHVGGAIAVSPDGSLVVSQASGDVEPFGGPIQLYDTETGAVAATLDDACIHDNRPSCIEWAGQLQSATFSPTGGLVAVSGFSLYGDDPIQGFSWVGFWNTDGEVVHLIADESGDVSFDPASDRVAIATEAGVSIRHADTLEELAIVEVTSVGDTEFSPDGNLLTVATRDNAIRVYETSQWSQVHEILTVADEVRFSSDGSRILSADVDGMVRLWDMETGDLLQVVPLERVGPGFAENRAGFVGDDRFVSIDSRTLLTLTLDQGALLDIARERVVRDFTEEECRLYLGLESCSDRARD